MSIEISDMYKAYMGLSPKKIPHWEHWSNPDAESYLTGMDYYANPRLCRIKLRELYPELGLPVPESGAPVEKTEIDDIKNHTVRWGDGQTNSFEHGEMIFKTPEEVFAFSPLAHPDMRDWPHVAMNWDFTSEGTLEAHLEKSFPKPWIQPEKTSEASFGYYNTMFMWPMLTFGWDMFLNCCLDDEFERIMDEFAEFNRRAFNVFAKRNLDFIDCLLYAFSAIKGESVFSFDKKLNTLLDGS